MIVDFPNLYIMFGLSLDIHGKDKKEIQSRQIYTMCKTYQTLPYICEKDRFFHL